MSDALKDYLTAIRDLACAATNGVEQIVGSTAGELGTQQKIDVGAKLRASGTGLQDRIEIILDGGQSPSFDPSSLGSTFTEYDPDGKGTDDMSQDLCEQAQEALDEYCEDDFTPAARMTRRMETTVVAFRVSAGMVE